MQREQQMADVLDSGQEMMDLEDRIMEKLEGLSPEDAKAMEEVLQELARLEEMLREMMEALSREGAELPEDFLNSDALKDLPLEDVFAGLQQIRDKLAAGDIKGAQQAAREMLKNLTDLLNRLREAGSEFEDRAGEAISRLRKSTIPEVVV